MLRFVSNEDAAETYFEGSPGSQFAAGGPEGGARLGRQDKLRGARGAGRRAAAGDAARIGEPGRRLGPGQFDVSRTNVSAPRLRHHPVRSGHPQRESSLSLLRSSRHYQRQEAKCSNEEIFIVSWGTIINHYI